MKKFKLNWKTTLAGICTGLPILVSGIADNWNIERICEGAGLILVGFFAKDARDQSKD